MRRVYVSTIEREGEESTLVRSRERVRREYVCTVEISSCKNKEYKKAKSFIWMFLKSNPHKR